MICFVLNATSTLARAQFGPKYLENVEIGPFLAE